MTTRPNTAAWQAAAVVSNESATLPAAIARELLHRIGEGRWSPGFRVTGQDLMVEFDASRAAVREAMARLEALGAVEQRRGVGTVVLGPPAACVALPAGPSRHLLELRVAIEAEAAGLAAVRRSDKDMLQLISALRCRPAENERRRSHRFHVAVCVATHNTHYARLVPVLLRAALPDAGGCTAADEAAQAVRRQRVIVSAIEARDTAAASAGMRMHLLQSAVLDGAR